MEWSSRSWPCCNHICHKRKVFDMLPMYDQLAYKFRVKYPGLAIGSVMSLKCAVHFNIKSPNHIVTDLWHPKWTVSWSSKTGLHQDYKGNGTNSGKFYIWVRSCCLRGKRINSANVSKTKATAFTIIPTIKCRGILYPITTDVVRLPCALYSTV